MPKPKPQRLLHERKRLWHDEGIVLLGFLYKNSFDVYVYNFIDSRNSQI